MRLAAPLRNALTPGPYGGASSQQLAAASSEWVVGFSPLNESDHSTLLWFSRLLSQLFDAPPLESPAGVSTDGGGGTENAGDEHALVYVECVPDLQTFLRLADMFIRRFIKFCKCLPEFSALHQDDQIRLLKVRTSALEHLLPLPPLLLPAQFSFALHTLSRVRACCDCRASSTFRAAVAPRVECLSIRTLLPSHHS